MSSTVFFLNLNSSLGLDTPNASNWDRVTPNFTRDLVSYHSAIETMVADYMFPFRIYILSSTDRAFHCITRQLFDIYIYIYIYISPNAGSGDGGNDSIFGLSIDNIHVIQNSKESSVREHINMYVYIYIYIYIYPFVCVCVCVCVGIKMPSYHKLKILKGKITGGHMH